MHSPPPPPPPALIAAPKKIKAPSALGSGQPASQAPKRVQPAQGKQLDFMEQVKLKISLIFLQLKLKQALRNANTKEVAVEAEAKKPEPKSVEPAKPQLKPAAPKNLSVPPPAPPVTSGDAAPKMAFPLKKAASSAPVQPAKPKGDVLDELKAKLNRRKVLNQEADAALDTIEVWCI